MDRVVPARGAELLQLQAVLILFLVLGRRVIAIFAITTLQCNDLAHCCLSPQSSALSDQLSAKTVLLMAEC